MAPQDMASQQAPNASMEQRLAAVERVLEVRAHDKGVEVPQDQGLGLSGCVLREATSG